VSVAIVTGAGGLVGAEAAAYFAGAGHHVVGIDNDMRREFFGEDATTRPSVERLRRALGNLYEHHDIDIRDEAGIGKIFERYSDEISLVIHTAAQPSHDWAARAPIVDFTVNANGTLVVVDQGYTGADPALDAADHGIRLEVVKLNEAKRGFVLLPRR